MLSASSGSLAAGFLQLLVFLAVPGRDPAEDSPPSAAIIIREPQPGGSSTGWQIKPAQKQEVPF